MSCNNPISSSSSSSTGHSALSMETIEAYVKELRLSNDNTTRGPPLTVEHILGKIYARFYNQKGQSSFPDGLPFAIKQIPSLASVAILQSRITAFIQSAVATRPVVTVYELESEVCLAENVSTYGELGLGYSLTCLPFVQHAFKINAAANVAPITSTDFLQFLLFDTHAQSLLTGCGDANDAVLSFSRRYKEGRYTTMQLGIHVQHFPWLMQFVRQEAGRVSAFFAQLQAINTHGYERNRVIYERALMSLHAGLMQREKSISSESPHVVTFVVHASLAEAETTDIPAAHWATSSGPSGGLCLHGTLRAEPVLCHARVDDTRPTLTAPPMQSASSCGTSAVPVATSIASAPPPHQNVGSTLVAHSHARKRRRGVVMDERTVVLDPTPVSVPHNPSESTPAVAATQAPLLPPIPLERVVSLLRCLAVMQTSSNAMYLDACDDFAAFKACAPQLLQKIGKGNDASVPSHGCVATPNDSFSVTLEGLLNLLSSHGEPEVLYKFYCALSGKINSRHRVDNKESDQEEDDTHPSCLLLRCLKAGMSELVFVPLLATDALLPLSAARNVLRGRVLMSGHMAVSTTDMLAFHPLHLILDPPSHGAVGGSVALVDGAALMRDSWDATPHHHHYKHQQQQQKEQEELLETFVSCGVLLRVPEEWFRDGLLLRLVQRLVPCHRDASPRSDAAECNMAMRMLLLYWWLASVWCDAPQSPTAAAVEELLQGLRETPWVPCLSRSNSSSVLRVVSWHAPSDLFPSMDCFTINGLDRLLPFAPHRIQDLLVLLRQNDDQHRWKPEGLFLEKWISAVEKHTRSTSAESSLPRLFGMPVACTAPVALCVLCSLQVGQRVPLQALRYLLQSIAGNADRGEEILLKARQQLLFPLPADRSDLCADRDFVVGEMAALDTLCWEPLASSKDGGGSDIAVLVFDRSIDFVGSDLRGFLVECLGVSQVPCVATWQAGALALRRRFMAGEDVNAWLTELFLRVLTQCCIVHFNYVRERFERHSASSGGDDDDDDAPAKAALDCVVNSVPDGSGTAYVFPLDGRWRCAAEGLFFCGSFYCGFSGLALQAGEGQVAPVLPVLRFDEQPQPHFVVSAVLKKMGLLALEECTEKIVTFGRINAASSAELHRQIEQCVPRVKEFLSTRYPHYYTLVAPHVRHLLEYFGIVLAAEPVLREVLRYQGSVYTMTQTVRCQYVRQHNCLYGVDEEFVPSVGANAIADLFLPMGDAEVRLGVVEALQQWLAGIDDTDRNLRLGGAPPLPLSHTADEAWQLSTPAAARFRDHFPVGRDGFGATGQSCTSTAAAAAALASSGGTQVPRVMVLPWGHGGHMTRSLPQWRCEMFGTAFDVLRAVERGSRDSGCNGRDDDEEDDDDADDTTGALPAYKRVRRGGRSQRSGPAMVVQERRDTADYSVAAERHVAALLRAEAPPGVEVVWVNEHGERGTPYDILLVRRRGDSRTAAATEIVAYVEVKSTCTHTRRDFELSLRELLFAARFGTAYKIYRVLRASTSVAQRMQVEVVEDVVRMWHTGALTMTGEVKVMLASR